MTTATVSTVLDLSSPAFEVCAYRGGLAVVDQLSDEWRALSQDAADDHPFYRPEWIRAHIRTFLPRAKVVVITVRKRGQLCLVLPLVKERGTYSKVPIRRLRAPVNVHGGRYDAVRRRGADGVAAIALACDYLAKLDNWDVLQICGAPADSTVASLVAMAKTRGLRTLVVPDRASPYVQVPLDAAALHTMPPNSKLRSQLRRARERLLQNGVLNFYRVDTADRHQLERLYQLEASGWKGQAGSAILCNGSQAFYDEIAAAAAQFGYLSLFMLEYNARLLAAHFAFTSGGGCFSPIVAYDEAFKQFAPGHLMVEEILRYCSARGIQRFDITGQDQPWKMKWTSETRSISNYFVFRGPLGQLAYGINTRLRSVSGLLPKHDA